MRNNKKIRRKDRNMKKYIFGVVAAIFVLMLVSCGCTQKEKNNNDNSGNISGGSNSLGEDIRDTVDDTENGIKNAADDIVNGAENDNNVYHADESGTIIPENDSDVGTTIPSDNTNGANNVTK